MAASLDQSEANRPEAQRPAGRRADEVTPRPLLNAFRHGMAGAGDLLAAHEDARAVAERLDDFAREFGARGRVGRLFARRAAVMSLRLEQAEAHTVAARAARMEEARAQFDRGRADELADLVATLDDRRDPRPTLAELEGSPEGVAFLVDRWSSILADLRSDGPDAQARRYLDRRDPATADRADLIASADAELDRLRRLANSMGHVEQAIAAARQQAATLGAFDPTPEAERARRHEAAVERSMYRACRAIAEHRRAYEAEAPAGLPPRPTPLPTPRPVTPIPPPPRPEPRPAPTALGSFPPGALPPLDADLADLFDRRAARDQPANCRAARPDLATLTASRR